MKRYFRITIQALIMGLVIALIVSNYTLNKRLEEEKQDNARLYFILEQQNDLLSEIMNRLKVVR